MIIAIDGPAAAGKGTLAARLARHFGLPYLDTGLLYRAVGKLGHSVVRTRVTPVTLDDVFLELTGKGLRD